VPRVKDIHGKRRQAITACTELTDALCLIGVSKYVFVKSTGCCSGEASHRSWQSATLTHPCSHVSGTSHVPYMGDFTAHETAFSATKSHHLRPKNRLSNNQLQVFPVGYNNTT
jgi:hypothetical protein